MPLLHLVLGLVGVLAGAEIAVRGSLGLARRWGWPAWLTGLVLVATGTSLPELFVSFVAATEHPTVAMGNVFGSNAFNVGVVLGCLLLMQRRQSLPVDGVSLWATLPIVAGSAAGFVFFDETTVSVWVGPIFIAAFVWMIAASFATQGARGLGAESEVSLEEIDGEPPTRRRSLRVELAQVIAGFVALSFCSSWFLDGALGVAGWFGLQDGFVGFLVTAVGTSAPELFTSIQAMRHGHPGAVIGNLVGSNGFNLLLVGGLVALRAEVPFDPGELSPQLWVNLGAALMLGVPGLLVLRGRSEDLHLPRWVGALLLAGYLAGAAWVSA